MATDTKECPSCGETIKAVAKKCKHCGEFLEGSKQDSNPSHQIGSSSIGRDSITTGDIRNSQGIAIGGKAQAVKAKGVSGSVIQRQGKVVLTEGISDAKTITEAFHKLQQALNQLPNSPNKQMAEVAIQGLRAEAEKNGKPDEKTVEQWFTNLMIILPDIGEVAINTFMNPIKGLSTVFQKVAQRAREAQQK